MKAAQRSRVRLMPRTKHYHDYSTIVSVRGEKVRYGCRECPKIDWYWYTLSFPWDDILRGTPATPRLQVKAALRSIRKLRAQGSIAKGVAKAAEKAADGLKTPDPSSGPDMPPTDPQGPNAGVGFHTPRHYIEGDDGALTKVDLIDYGPHAHGLGEIVEVSEEADTSDVPDYTREQLQAMKRGELYKLAQQIRLPGRSVMDVEQLRAAILTAQEAK